MNFFTRIFAIICVMMLTNLNAQTLIPATNIRNGSTNNTTCSSCQPDGWFNFGGTPDMSNITTVAATGTSGGGTKWTRSPLTPPPNNHNKWITIRDIGNAGTEESVGTIISNLRIGKEYEVVIYSMTAQQATYSNTYLTNFTFHVVDIDPKTITTANQSNYPRINVNSIKRDTDNAWSISKLRFTATKTEMYLALYPGKTATGTTGSSFKSVNLSVTANSINSVPVTENKTAETVIGKPVIIDVLADAYDDDQGQMIVVNTVDLDPSTDGIQRSLQTSQGLWIVNQTDGKVTFTPAPGFYGIANAQFTVQDNYTINGNSAPGTSAPKSISIQVVPCTEGVNGSDFSVSGGQEKTFNMPATDYGFQFDVYELDNSFNLTINGIKLAKQEIEFQKGTSLGGQNIRFKDGTIWEEGGISDIWRLRGTKDAPIIRIVIDPYGNVTMFGSKSSGGILEPLELFNGNSFNIITWNTKSNNTVVATQSVIGTTLMKGHGSGRNVAPCFCTKTPNTQSADSFTNIGVSTKRTKLNNWPHTIPNGFIALESSNKGLVITRTPDISKITTPKEGMIIYDKAANCVKLYNGTIWKCIQRDCND